MLRKVLLKNLQHSQESTCFGVSFWYSCRPSEDFNQVFSCVYCEVFKGTYLEEHLWTTASVITWKFFDISEISLFQ